MKISIGIDPDLICYFEKNSVTNYVAPKLDTRHPELNYLGDDHALRELAVGGNTFFFGLDDPKRRSILDSEFNLSPISVISDTSVVRTEIQESRGITVADFVYVGPNVHFGRFVKLNVRSSIHHDVEIGNYSVIAPSVTICGSVKLGSGVFLGAGATVLPGITIGDFSIVGAGAVVTRNLPAHGIFVGVPARINEDSG
ncbi:NeuD_NnaD, sugar O-acyltransferase, sialic acid O-acetyltransferase NeuD family [Candidatus Nanopelagicaceae bacterium]